MPFASFVPLLSPTIAFAGFMLVILQLRRGTKQRELDSLVKLCDINRQLITLGFSQPELFSILADDLRVATPVKISNEVEKCVWDPDSENRFRQSLPIHRVEGRLKVNIGNIRWLTELSVQV